MRYYTLLLSAALLSTPLIASAQGSSATLQSILRALSGVVGAVVPVVFALILLGFLWGIARYVLALSGKGPSDNQKKSGQVMSAKNILGWSTVALFVAASIWGLVAFLAELTGTTAPVEVPAVPSYGGSSGGGSWSDVISI